MYIFMSFFGASMILLAILIGLEVLRDFGKDTYTFKWWLLKSKKIKDK